MTPADEYAFVGDPLMIRPQADEVHISVAFTWDIEEAERLMAAWAALGYSVKSGGPALASPCNGFVSGMYVKQGITFTSRGCNNNCPWCLVPEHEGRFKQLDDIEPGYVIQDNNLLQASAPHISKVFRMLRCSRRAASFAGGLDATLITDSIADELRGLRIGQIFFACDTDSGVAPLAKAISKLPLGRDKLRCYVLLAYNGESLEKGRDRLERVWEIGAMPFAQLYQPPHHYIKYSQAWRNLARTWSRPAAMKAIHEVESDV